MSVSDSAIVSTLLSILDLPAESVVILSESVVANITNDAQVLVKFKALAPLQEGFDSYETCFTHYVAKLQESIESLEIYNTLVTVAEDMGAYELYSITAVNITSFENQGAINTAVPDRDDISEGDFAGVVIGIVLAFLVVVALLYLCFSGCGSYQQQGSGGGGSARTDQLKEKSSALAGEGIDEV